MRRPAASDQYLSFGGGLAVAERVYRSSLDPSRLPTMYPQLRAYHQRKMAGLCGQCGKRPPLEDKTRCKSCTTKYRRQNEAYRTKKPLGICRNCSRPARPKRSDCAECSARSLLKQKQKQQEIRFAVLKLYGGRCICCGCSNYKYLQLDHVNNDGNAERRKLPFHIRGSKFYKYVLKLGYHRRDLQLLCGNCHQAKTRYGGCTVEDHPPFRP